jgi:2-polyprenyl-6-methoxyphenol hydroxylase-like FAD-dependent oxidoreductase
MAAGKIVIIGAGIGGLAAALALLRRGIEVEVYEQAATLAEVGAGVQMSANGTRVLFALGLEPALAQVQVTPSRRVIRHWSSGETWDWFALGVVSAQRFGTPHLMLHRSDLHGILAAAVRALKPDAIRLGKRCVGTTQTPDRAEARFADGSAVAADIVIGADGIHSQVRADLFGADRPQFTGCVAWRGLTAMDALPPHLAEMVGSNWFGPRGHVLHYPVRRGELMNFVGFVERDDWQVESWSAAGTVDELGNDFAGWHEDVHAIIRMLETPFRWALMVRGAMARWSRGRIALLGDACHPTLPFLGQGAVMAIEDGWVLAACLARYGDDPAAAFARYEAIRCERTATVVRKSHEMRGQAFSPALADAGPQDTTAMARDWQQARARERLEWLYAYDATAVEI